MADDSEFITKLIGFGLSEKEAQLYLHLLKYGPKPPSLLAKSLKTYREDVYRTLTVLIDKGMVKPSLETPTVYAAVDLDIALETALRKHEAELRELEFRKRELQELSKQQRFRPSDEYSTFKILKSVKEIVTVSISSLTSAQKELLFVVPGAMLVIASLYGINEESKQLIEHGGRIRGISDISYMYIEPAQELLNIGEDIRHYDQYRGIFFGVIDRKICFSSINADISRISLDEPSILLWTDDPTYASYLTSTFELLWEQSVPAAQRIEELLKEGPPEV
jgi:sugar-specific transcriptional regulator TrmB